MGEKVVGGGFGLWRVIDRGGNWIYNGVLLA